MTRTTGVPRLVTANGVTVPAPVPLTETLISESFIQKLVHENPELLPTEEIGGGWGPLVSLGREIPTEVGPIDNLFVSPTGEITVVEAKLWRNNEARRKVVAQILDYASHLRQLDYTQLEAAINQADASTASLWTRVCGARQSAGVPVDETAEGSFVDAVSRNLAAGRFLLLIVGDGIRTEIEAIADLLGQHPDMGFHLELVELKLYQLADDYLVVPSLVGRTAEINRATVSVVVESDGGVAVSVTAAPEEVASSNGKKLLNSTEEFETAASDAAGADYAAFAMELVNWWTATHGTIRLYQTALSLDLQTTLTVGKKASICAIYQSGLIYFNASILVDYLKAWTLEELIEPMWELGLTGPKSPKFDFGAPGRPELGALTDLLDKIVHDVRLHEATEEVSQ